LRVRHAIVCAGVALISCAAAPTPPTDLGTVDAFVRLLEQHGATVARAGAFPQSSHSYFSVTGEGLVVNGAEVTVFAYRSVDRAANDAARVSPTGSPIGETQISWMDIPHLYRRDRLIVLYVGHSAELLKVLERVLGPPFAAGR
jgi:hypothetical protein